MKSNKGKVIFYSAGVILVFTVLGALFNFLYVTVLEESAKVAEAEKEIAVLERKDREFADAVRDLAEFKEEIDGITKSFVSENTFVAYLESIESLGKLTGVFFEALSANFEVAEGEPAIFSFSATGNFGALVNFFALLDNLPQTGILNSVTLTLKDPVFNIVQARADYLIFNHTK